MGAVCLSVWAPLVPCGVHKQGGMSALHHVALGVHHLHPILALVRRLGFCKGIESGGIDRKTANRAALEFPKPIEGAAKERHPATKLSPILPLVLAQDKDRWKTSTRFHELFTFPEGPWNAVRACTPDFAFRLLQLVEIPYEDIRGTPEGVLTLRSLKAAPLGELLHSLVWERAVIAGVSLEAVECFFRYVLNANIDRDAFQARVALQQSRPLTELAMTLADRIRQEGHQEGHQEGRQKGRIEGHHEGVLEMLEIRFGAVPEGLTEALLATSDLDRLKALHSSALTCPDLEVFAAGL